MTFEDDTIDLRSKGDHKPEFKIGPLDDDYVFGAGGGGEVEDDELVDKAYSRASNKVKVKFDKFVNLIMTHDCGEILDRHVDEEIVMTTDLLADLANCPEERTEKKGSAIFVGGIVLGLIVSWLIFKIL